MTKKRKKIIETACRIEPPSHKIERILNEGSDLQQSHDLLNIIFEAINSTVGGVVITDKPGFIVYVNPAFLRMFEIPDRIEILGKNAADFFLSQGIRRFSDVQIHIEKTEGETEEFRLVKNNGQIFDVEVSTSEVADCAGNVVGRMGSFIDISERKRLERERENLVLELQDALEKIKTLRGMIPICAACKSIRDDEGFWHRVEVYIQDHSEAQFTHGICPDCVKRLYGDL